MESIYADNACFLCVCNSFAGNLSSVLKTGSTYSALAFDTAFCFSPAGAEGEGEGSGDGKCEGERDGFYPSASWAAARKNAANGACEESEEEIVFLVC